MRLGVHVPIAGGFDNALGWAERLNCSAMQLFSRSPRGGKAPAIDPKVARAFTERRLKAGITPLAVHGPYVLNLASPDPEMWRRSVALFIEEISRADSLKADYLVMHLGSHKGKGVASGIQQIIRALNKAVSQQGGVTILLENTAGSGDSVGSRFEDLAAIRAGVRMKQRIGICLDTAHLFAAGFEIHTAIGLRKTLDSFDRVVGLKHLMLVHLNDSKVPLGSCVDRHWHIGKGQIGLAAMRRIVREPRLREVPWILETPKTTEAEDKLNLATVRRLARNVRRRAIIR